ncbi:MAG TPA: CHRD domain-containing protein [Acidimicrobiia bacterium]
MRKLRILSILTVLMMVMAIPAFAAGRSLSADLSPSNEVPPTASNASGTVDVLLNPAKGEVCVHLKSGGFEGAVIAGHIHEGPVGVNGPVVVNLEVNSATFENCVAADADLIKDIGRNPSDYYVNIHTTAFPGGEIRGQLSK